jgi:hypothetical protein
MIRSKFQLEDRTYMKKINQQIKELPPIKMSKLA